MHQKHLTKVRKYFGSHVVDNILVEVASFFSPEASLGAPNKLRDGAIYSQWREQ
jgi:hypothetical protein